MKNKKESVKVKYVSKEQAAANYISKAMTLLDNACNLYKFCDGCPMRNIETGKCMLVPLRDIISLNCQ